MDWIGNHKVIKQRLSRKMILNSPSGTEGSTSEGGPGMIILMISSGYPSRKHTSEFDITAPIARTPDRRDAARSSTDLANETLFIKPCCARAQSKNILNKMKDQEIAGQDIFAQDCFHCRKASAEQWKE